MEILRVLINNLAICITVLCLTSCMTPNKLPLEKCNVCINCSVIETDCELLEYLREYNQIESQCLMEITKYFTEKTGIESSLEFGLLGAYYSSDSLLQSDILKWSIELDCKVR